MYLHVIVLTITAMLQAAIIPDVIREMTIIIGEKHVRYSKVTDPLQLFIRYPGW